MRECAEHCAGPAMVDDQVGMGQHRSVVYERLHAGRSTELLTEAAGRSRRRRQSPLGDALIPRGGMREDRAGEPLPATKRAGLPIRPEQRESISFSSVRQLASACQPVLVLK